VKRRFYQKCITGGLAMIMFFSLFTGINKAEAAAPSLKVNADSAIIVDGKTGKVLFEQNADSLLGIASMSKMMTEYILLDSIKHGKVKWDQKYSVDDLVYKLSQKRELSNVPLRRDGVYTVRELYDAMAIYSANAETIALAEVMAGSETNFLKMMNKEAKVLGLKDYKFVNSTGLNNKDYDGGQPEGTSATDENAMSARSVATLAFHLINDFPDVLKTASIPKKTFRAGTADAIVMDNWNWMLPSLIYGYQGMDGLKTGTTDFAGACFTGTAMRNGQRFITVVQNAKDANGKPGDKSARFSETRKMLDYAFSTFSNQELVPNHYQVKGNETLAVIKGKASTVKIYTKPALNMVVANGDKQNYKPVLVLDKKMLDKNGKLVAPIKKGEKIGYLTVAPKNGEKVNFLTPEGQKGAKVDVVAAQDVEKANWFVLMMRGIGSFFGDVGHGISSTVKGWFK
jgi:serine-type D-Ala-D-Ala carboxypeptidase (penicillin-binding protein 5/6)